MFQVKHKTAFAQLYQHWIVFIMVLTFALTATATVLWDVAEFTGDQLFDTNIQISLANTMQDQFLGIVGGLTWIYINYWKPFAVNRTEKIK